MRHFEHSSCNISSDSAGDLTTTAEQREMCLLGRREGSHGRHDCLLEVLAHELALTRIQEDDFENVEGVHFGDVGRSGVVDPCQVQEASGG